MSAPPLGRGRPPPDPCRRPPPPPAARPSTSTNHRHATATRGDHRDTGVDEQSDGLAPRAVATDGGRDDSTPSPCVPCHGEAALVAKPKGGGLVIHRANRLGRHAERRVIAAHDGLRQEGRHRAAGCLAPQLLLEQVADHALTLGAEHVERVRPRRLVSFGLEQQHPYLRAVPVGQNNRMSVVEQRCQRSHRALDVPALNLSRDRLASPSECVASQSDNDRAHLSPSQSPVTRA